MKIIWPEYELWVLITFGALAVTSLVLVFLSWRRRWAFAAGMRYPAKRRLDGVAPGWRARLVHFPLVLRAAAVILLLAALTAALPKT